MTNLRDYQTDLSDKAAQLLKTYKIAYLAMEVRTGKTITAIAAAYKYGAKTVLFVTKKKAITDIIEQAKQMGFDMEIYVTNYEQLKYVEDKFDVVIVDEAHSISAYPKPSMRAYDIKRIAKGTPIIYLSGTPTPESFSQIFNQFWVSDYSPFKEYKSFYRWADDYVNVKKKYIAGNAHNDYKDANELLIREKTQHLFLTFTQQQAGFMQMVQENIFYVKMEDSTYKFAEKLIKDKIVTNKDGESVLAETGVKLMQKLHQIYSGTIIIDQPLRRAKVFDNTKAEFIRGKFSHLNKIAVFYKFTAELASLIDVFDKQICLDAQEFANRDSGVYISQIVSGREGINLSSAEALIFLNIDFSATSYWQARARIQTKDREEEAQIYWIFAYNGIEDKIYKAVSDKKDYTLNYFKKDYL